MISSFLFLPLASALMSSPVSANNLWQIDYDAAKQNAIALHKPMAVIVGEGQEGWKQLTIEHSINESVERMLSDNYVCLYVDKTTEAGKLLADKLDVKSSTGLVISDRVVELQAFNHCGVMVSTDLLGVLSKYSTTTSPVTRTENLNPTYVVSTINAVQPPVMTTAGVTVPDNSTIVVPNANMTRTYVPNQFVPVHYPIQYSTCPNGNCSTCPNGNCPRQ